jgi:hypothetical protein
MKKEGSILCFGQFFTNFPTFFLNTYQKKADSIYTGTPLHPLLWWLNKTYDNTGKLKGGDNILKARIRSNNNVFTYYVVLVTFSIRGNFHPWNGSPNMDMYMSTKNLTMDCYHLINTLLCMILYWFYCSAMGTMICLIKYSVF